MAFAFQLRRLTSLRLWTGVVVTGCWLASMATLVRREGGLEGRGLRELGVSPEVLLVQWGGDYEDWMSVTQNGHALGYTQLLIGARPEIPPPPPGARERPGYRMNSRARLKFTLLGLDVPIDLQIRADMNQAFELQTIEAQLQAAGQRLALQGFTQGNQLYYRLRTGPDGADWATTAPLKEVPAPAAAPGSPAAGLAALLTPRDVCGRMPLKGPILLSDVVAPILLRTQKIAPGAAWSTDAADNLLAGKVDTTLHMVVESRESVDVDHHPTDAWRVSERMGPVTSMAWYDMLGNLLRHELPNGIVLERMSSQAVIRGDAGFRKGPNFPPFDPKYVREHLDPELTGKPLGDLLPELPRI